MPDTVIVTGASAGIGLAIATHFVEQGQRVIGLARRPCPDPAVESLRVDLCDAGALDLVLTGIVESLPPSPRLHLIHSASHMPSDGAEDLDPERLAQTLRLNVVAPAQIDARLLPAAAPGSSVVFIGSTLCEKAVPGKLSYVTSKHALLGLMRATVQDLFGRSIHALCVAPGFVDTDMLRPALERDPEFERSVLDMVSFGRLLDPNEIAEIVAFATRTPALNGAVIHANLGQREA